MDFYGFWNPANNHFCDIIVYKPGQNNTLTISPTETVLDTDDITYKSIGFLPGTCFVVSVPTKNIYIGSSKLACLVATASHVAFDYFSHRFKISNIEISFALNRKTDCIYKCFPIQDFVLKYKTPEMMSPTNGNSYFLPGDLALLGILQDSDQEDCFVPLSPADFNEVEINKECTVIGHPVRPKNLSYCLHQESSSIENDIKITKCFCGFNCMVKSNGTINNFDNCLIEVKCSTTNGMSGSQIIINTRESQKYIGLYIGGPPLPYQRLLMLVQEYAEGNNFTKGYSLLRNTADNLSFIGISDKIGIVQVFERIAYLTVIDNLLKEHCSNIFEWDKKSFKKLAKSFRKNGVLTTMNFKLKSHERFVNDIYKALLISNPKNTLECLCSELERGSSSLKKRLQVDIEGHIYNILQQYDNKSALTFNVGISINHPAFQELLKISNVLSSAEGSFQTVEQFLALIPKI